MRTRLTLLACLLTAALGLAGCDTCVECRCTCDHQQPNLEVKVVSNPHGFDCGQACERKENCGSGDVLASECLREDVVDGRITPVRCARAEAPRTPRR